MGQRGTTSQHITYQDVFVRDGWHYHVPGFEPALIPGVFLMRSCISFGIGLGANDAVLDFIRAKNRTPTPGLKDPARDPLVTRHLGVWSTNLSAAHALQHSVAQRTAQQPTINSAVQAECGRVIVGGESAPSSRADMGDGLHSCRWQAAKLGSTGRIERIQGVGGCHEESLAIGTDAERTRRCRGRDPLLDCE